MLFLLLSGSKTNFNNFVVEIARAVVMRAACENWFPAGVQLTVFIRGQGMVSNSPKNWRMLIRAKIDAEAIMGPLTGLFSLAICEITK